MAADFRASVPSQRFAQPEIVTAVGWRQLPPRDEAYLLQRKAADAKLQPYAPLIIPRDPAVQEQLQKRINENRQAMGSRDELIALPRGQERSDRLAERKQLRQDTKQARAEARNGFIDFTLSKEDIFTLISTYLTVMPDSGTLHFIDSTILTIKFTEGDDSFSITLRNGQYHIDLSRSMKDGIGLTRGQALGCGDLGCVVNYIRPFIEVNDVVEIYVTFYTHRLPMGERRSIFYLPKNADKTLEQPLSGGPGESILRSPLGPIIRRVLINKDNLRDGVEELFFFTNSGQPLITRYWIKGKHVSRQEYEKSLASSITLFAEMLPDLSNIISGF